MILPLPASIGTGCLAAPPSSLGSRLAMWWRSDQGTYQDAAGTTPATSAGQSVRRWADLSGNGRHLLQSGASGVPTLAADTLCPNGLALSLSPTQLLAVGAVAALQSVELSLFVVAASPADTSALRFLLACSFSDLPSAPFTSCVAWNTGGGGKYIALTVNATGVWETNTADRGGVPMPILHTWQMDNTIVTNWGMSGKSVRSITAHGRTTNSGTWLGVRGADLGNPWSGRVYEAAVIAGVMTEAERRSLLLYAKARYGL